MKGWMVTGGSSADQRGKGERLDDPDGGEGKGAQAKAHGHRQPGTRPGEKPRVIQVVKVDEVEPQLQAGGEDKRRYAKRRQIRRCHTP